MTEDRKRTEADHPAQTYSDGMGIGCSVVDISADGRLSMCRMRTTSPIGFDL
jgi:hypothetical protein